MTPKHTFNISTDNGNEVVSGLSLMSAILSHPDFTEPQLDILEQIHTLTGVSRETMQCQLQSAFDFIDHIAKTVHAGLNQTPTEKPK